MGHAIHFFCVLDCCVFLGTNSFTSSETLIIIDFVNLTRVSKSRSNNLNA